MYFKDILEKYNYEGLDFPKEVISDKNFAFFLVEQDLLKYKYIYELYKKSVSTKDNEYLKLKSEIYSLLNTEDYLNKIDKNIFKDRDFALKCVKKSGFSILYFPKEYYSDKEVFLNALETNKDLNYEEISGIFVLANDSLKNDLSFCLKAIEFDKYSYKHFNCSIKNNSLIKEIALNKGVIDLSEFKNVSDYSFNLEKAKKIIEVNSLNLKFLPEKIKDNYELIEMAVKYNPFSFQYASDSLRNDFNLSSLVVQKEPLAYSILSKNLQINKEICKLAVLNEEIDLLEENTVLNSILNNNKDIFSDREFAEFCCSQNGYYYTYFNEIFKDKELALISIKTYPYIISHYDSWKNDIDYIIKSIQINKEVLDIIKPEIIENKSLVYSLIELNPYYINDFDSYKNDIKAVYCALKNNHSHEVFGFFSSEIQQKYKTPQNFLNKEVEIFKQTELLNSSFSKKTLFKPKINNPDNTDLKQAIQDVKNILKEENKEKSSLKQ